MSKFFQAVGCYYMFNSLSIPLREIVLEQPPNKWDQMNLRLLSLQAIMHPNAVYNQRFSTRIQGL